MRPGYYVWKTFGGSSEPLRILCFQGFPDGRIQKCPNHGRFDRCTKSDFGCLKSYRKQKSGHSGAYHRVVSIKRKCRKPLILKGFRRSKEKIDATGFEPAVYAPLRSAQNRRPPDVVGPLRPEYYGQETPKGSSGPARSLKFLCFQGFVGGRIQKCPIHGRSCRCTKSYFKVTSRRP